MFGVPNKVAQPSRLRKTEKCFCWFNRPRLNQNVSVRATSPNRHKHVIARSKATKQSMYEIASLSLAMTLVCQIII